MYSSIDRNILAMFCSIFYIFVKCLSFFLRQTCHMKSQLTIKLCNFVVIIDAFIFGHIRTSVNQTLVCKSWSVWSVDWETHRQTETDISLGITVFIVVQVILGIMCFSTNYLNFPSFE